MWWIEGRKEQERKIAPTFDFHSLVNSKWNEKNQEETSEIFTKKKNICQCEEFAKRHSKARLEGDKHGKDVRDGKELFMMKTLIKSEQFERLFKRVADKVMANEKKCQRFRVI